MKRLKGWKLSAGVIVFVFSFSILLLPGSVTTSIAAQGAAASAGAKAGAATAAGISKGTIAAIVIAAAAIAGIIAASGDDDGGVVAVSGTPLDEALAKTDATTEAALSQLTQALTGAGELDFLNDFMASIDSNVLADYQDALSENLTLTDVTEALDALTAGGLLKGTLLKGVSSDFKTIPAWRLYSILYDNLNNTSYSNGAKALANLLASLVSGGNLAGLTGLKSLMASITANELDAIKSLVAGIAADPSTYLDTLLTALHPGYDVTVTTVDHGGGIKTTTVHLTKQ